MAGEMRALSTLKVSWLNPAGSQMKNINESKGCLIFNITVQENFKGWVDSAADTNLQAENKIQGCTWNSPYLGIQAGCPWDPLVLYTNSRNPGSG